MLFKDLPDTYFENAGFTHIRKTVRGLVHDNEGHFYMLKIEGEDSFGVRNHYETPGGGVEPYESYEKALHREIQEELGLAISIDQFIGMVVSHYNHLQRINVERFFLCTVTGTIPMNRTESESILVKDVVTLSLDAVIEKLRAGEEPVDRLVHDRDLAAFLYVRDGYNR